MTLISVLIWTLLCCCFTESRGQVTVTQPGAVRSDLGGTVTITLSPDSTPGLLHLLLLAELFVHTSSRPTHSPSLCGMFGAMNVHVEELMSLSKGLHGLSDDELENVASMENRLTDLPHIQDTAAHFGSMKVNKSLSQLYSYTSSFTLHVDWLKTAKENFSLPSSPTEGVKDSLVKLSNLLSTSLKQISADVPQSPAPSFPVVSTAFDVLQFSIEVADQLQVFCDWSKRVLRHLQKGPHCHRR
ncbi:hypothetical protein Q5P01_018767 [Channa striata]|uniref:Uncharacterized protein n=1 Tax=Channa striata TaxID=64152 RepID=A0AA88M560_CHASR|nr:hypothetical protein Q5P01_018767 [Channa striata]